ncbi:pimeloyl-ACP methyl ester carboxylesterase [Kitasatospora sp. SolWspMP-SS2h]|uniref:alpha/beta fold hydrolase n=1 Tax=Kitasatospora sp. SolWspMP-SS2h TaxID=1305729 RepID=UPI000DBA75C6|nr:alpha/beta fold hydrolase [Kitasatospora sp. SolWspMP-SS2h]RAJ34639.1 pimeloyl-ACP methyl ester carboxylesterase [Kitasatospora sp. SolWspMP-SS2h]
MSRRIPADCVLPDPAAVRTVRSADGAELNVEEYGPAGAPLVVLAHGWTCSTAFWAPVVNRLAADFRVVAYDQRGHGRSPAPAGPAGYATAKLAEDLEAVLTATVPEGRRAVVVGHSMGGMTIMAAGDRPAVAARTAANVLVNTGPGALIAELTVLPPAVRAKVLRRFLHRQILRSRLPLGPVTGLTRAALKYATMGPATPADRVEACAQVVHACPAKVRFHWATVLDTLDVQDGLAKLTAPTAVIAGSHDRLTPPVHARRIAAALADPRGLLELPGTGHMSPLERPAEVAAEIRRVAALVAAEPPTAEAVTAEAPTAEAATAAPLTAEPLEETA